MNSRDDMRRAFGNSPFGDNPSHADRVTGEDAKGSGRDEHIQFAGSGEYRPFGWKPRGAQSCEIIWYDPQRGEARAGMVWEYRTLLRIGYEEINPAVGQMTVLLYLADVNVMIEGYHLYPLIERLRSRECAMIEQLSSRRHSLVQAHELVERGDTIIERVQTDLGLLYTSNAVRN